jgi:predicted metalloprotease with PDZ domain
VEGPAPQDAPAALMSVVYRLLVAEPHTHHVVVDLEVDGVEGPARLVMPSWTPGSYLMREFPRNVVSFAAGDASAHPLPHRKLDKNTWEVDAPADGKLRVRYLVYADELSVRTSHVDASHAFISGTSVFMQVAGREKEDVRVEVRMPRGWTVATALEERAPGSFRARDYDELADAPLEIGTHEAIDFEVDGVPHRYALWGRGNYDRERLAADTARIVRTEKALFGELPYRAYTLILHLANGGSGGLEHRDCSVLQADRWAFRGQPYESFLGLVAHEIFHAWNGKRIRPAALGPFDYTREAYTRELWVVEGFTTYYTDVILRRAGLISPQRFLDRLAEQLVRHFQTPGRMVQPLEDASFDTWIKFYRPDANTPNATISYYAKGALVALLLDLEIRRRTGNARSLDDLMRALWAESGAPDVGFAPGRVEALASEIAGSDLGPLFDQWLRSTAELSFDEAFATVGVVIRPMQPPSHAPGGMGEAAAERPRQEIRTGMQIRSEHGRVLVGSVLAGSAAWRAGVSANDELLALDGFRVHAESFVGRLQEKAPGEKARLTLFRRDELREVEMDVEPGPPSRVLLRTVESPTPEQRAMFESWLREEPPRG